MQFYRARVLDARPEPGTPNEPEAGPGPGWDWSRVCQRPGCSRGTPSGRRPRWTPGRAAGRGGAGRPDDTRAGGSGAAGSAADGPGGPPVATGWEVGERLGDWPATWFPGSPLCGPAAGAGMGITVGTPGSGDLGVGLGTACSGCSSELLWWATAAMQGPSPRRPDGSEPRQVATVVVIVLPQAVGLWLPVAATTPPAATNAAATPATANLAGVAPTTAGSERDLARSASRWYAACAGAGDGARKLLKLRASSRSSRRSRSDWPPPPGFIW